MKSQVFMFQLFFLLSGLIQCMGDARVFIHMGCFDLGYSLRMNYHRHMPGVTLGDCVQYCSIRKTKYAGIERSDNFCYCGSDIAEESTKRLDFLCNVDCPDYPAQKCGGDWLMSVYDISGELRGSTVTPLDQGEKVGFLVGTSVGVTAYNTSDIQNPTTVMQMADWAYAVDYHWKKNLVFAFSKKQIFKSTSSLRKSPLFTSSVQPIKAVTSCDGFAVDWEQDRIYWANCSVTNTTIMSMDLNGQNNLLVMTRPGESAGVRRMEIDPYQKKLFWLADGVIESCSLSGLDFKANMSVPKMMTRAMALDLAKQMLYFVGNDDESSSLYKMNYYGGNVQKVFSLPMLKSVYGLGLLRDKIYWINYASARDVLYSAPLNLTNVNQVRTIKPIEKAVWHLRLVHPDLQTRPSRGPCDSKNCSYYCTLYNNIAKCTCPSGFHLVEDGVSCIVDIPPPGPCDVKGCSHSCTLKNNMANCMCPSGLYLDDTGVSCVEPATQLPVEPGKLVRSEPESNGLVLTILTVGLSVVLAAGLLYVGDRYWPTLKAKVKGVPYVRQGRSEGSVNPQYDTTDDNVNLI